MLVNSGIAEFFNVIKHALVKVSGLRGLSAKLSVKLMVYAFMYHRIRLSYGLSGHSPYAGCLCQVYRKIRVGCQV